MIFQFLSACTVDTDVQCGGQLSGSGFLTSPRYPEAYPLNTQCMWIITAPPGNGVVLRISAFDIESDGGPCDFDYLEVRD